MAKSEKLIQKDNTNIQKYAKDAFGNIPEEKTINQQSQVENLVEPLTNREYEILELLGKRLTNKEIAAQLVIAPGTVEQHLVRINSKLNVRGRRQAVAKARELGLLSS